MSDLKDTGLHPFTIKALERNGVSTRAELLELTQEQLHTMRGIGPSRLAEIITWQTFYRHGEKVAESIAEVLEPLPKPVPPTFWQRVRNFFR